MARKKPKIRRGSHAYFLNEIVKAIDRQTVDMGKWLATIAEAAANPDDNSEEIAAQIERIRKSRKQIEDAVHASGQD
jgi:hypothetical protein